MCGICGLLRTEPGGLPTLVTRLALVNHRGHETVGIAATNGVEMWSFRDFGYVREACTESREAFRSFARATLGEHAHAYIGHTRYATVGGGDIALAQPIGRVHPVFGKFFVAHNGQLPNHRQLRQHLSECGQCFETTSDSEVLAALIAQSAATTLPMAVAEVVRELPAAFSFLALDRCFLVAARDRLGMRPLWWRQSARRVLVASEVGALTDEEDDPLEEIPPGAMVVAERTPTGLRTERTPVAVPSPAQCLFEALYFARPDQRIGASAAGVIRQELGRRLARACPAEADVVCGVPESGTAAALGFAHTSGLPFEPYAFVKNWYVVPARSFILPTREQRTHAASLKYNANATVVAGKRVVVVDDTIVRGNTTPKLTAALRRAGAAEVHWRIAASPIRHPCFYGIDIPTSSELLAFGKTEAEVCAAVGADSLRYLPYAEMVAVAETASSGWCTACFTGHYPTAVPSP